MFGIEIQEAEAERRRENKSPLISQGGGRNFLYHELQATENKIRVIPKKTEAGRPTIRHFHL
ncbi:Hypothetical predicted protein [Podarcis lilfordi]|uniref:Uncharacterized protein n=1 Tax=Podarcis lilfordi TaxID=74358 RepID=A0AA35LIX1_9SAUR|nr:Hypothetical predicted protein [Podarcis lilfordi]